MLRQARERSWAGEKLLQEPREGVSASEAATLPCSGVLERLGATPEGLTSEEAGRRLAAVGPNAILSHHARPFAVLARQFRSPLLGLLVATAAVSFFLGERSDALAIGAILGSSVILGFSNEYRAERAAEALHDELRYTTVVRRDGVWKLCRDVGLPVEGSMTGTELDALDDAALRARLAATTIFSRVSPEQKSRIIRAQRAGGADVAFLGDGVNDAVALHHADIGISVESATDLAKDAADVVLLEKDLGVLADGVVEGRRIFANTIKYVLMGTSSNFGNMFSAAAVSAFLTFLPMLPFQILLNNLLYDAGQMTIPSDRVDEEQLARPAHWDLGFIRRFMLFFGPVSSLFDFLTFAVMLGIFHAGPALFRSGWFVESLATQSLVIFVIRTRRVPFFRSRPSRMLTTATLAVVGIGMVLPLSPLSHALGFQPLPVGYFGALVAMVVAYLVLVEAAKLEFFRFEGRSHRVSQRVPNRRILRRAGRFTHGSPV